MKTTTVLERMLDGFPGVDKLLPPAAANATQTQQLDELVAGVLKYREYRQLTRGLLEAKRATDPLDEPVARDKPLVLHPVAQAQRARFAMTPAEMAAFEHAGIAGPFPLLSADETLDLRKYVVTQYQNDFGGNTAFSDEIRTVLKRNNAWGINAAGLYQALFDKRLWDLHCRPEITDRLACLMGEDILCWRTQMFESPPGNPGTFWHQAGRFRELADQPKLAPTTAVDDNMIQLTAWIALQDVTVNNSCLRFLSGSFNDGRFERFMYAFFDHLIGYLYDKPEAQIRDQLRVMHFQSSIFKKAQLAFFEAVARKPDLYESYEHVDMQMKAGEFIIFSSMNMHASRPNRTEVPRLALAGRYTTNDVKVLSGIKSEPVSTPEGVLQWPLDKVGCIQARGVDRFGWNKIVAYPW